MNSWHGRRVFLTGHTGFKGCWLALWLTQLGAKVRGYGLDPATQPNMLSATGAGHLIDDVRGDILHFPRLRSAMADFKPEVVFHLAAQPLVRASYADPVMTYTTNVIGTANVLEAVRNTPGVKAVVCITTDKCYENQEWVWPYREIDQLGGYDPYSSSKACAELVTAAYRSSFFPVARLAHHGVAVATARAGNVIGGGDWSEDRLIPDLIRGFESGQPVRIRRPDSIRPWQHVLEPLHGYILLAEQLIAGKARCASAYNFGPDDQDAWTVDRIVTKLVGLWGDGASWVRDPDPGVHEAGFLRLDSSKARSELNWIPRLSIEVALDWTANWYRALSRGDDMHDFTLGQIAAYGNL